MTLETYARERAGFKARVMAHKTNRMVHLGQDVTLLFEDELTIRYQVQEMLHAERIFEEKGIRDELDTYNPLIPDGRNLKATLMIEFADPDERRKRLADLIGIEDNVCVQVQGHERVWAIADEDLERENEHKTAAVHFLRFELSEDMAGALKSGASLTIGVDHPRYSATVETSAAVRDSLVKDLA
jgi:uncharacterized protein DUF3501